MQGAAKRADAAVGSAKPALAGVVLAEANLNREGGRPPRGQVRGAGRGAGGAARASSNAP